MLLLKLGISKIANNRLAMAVLIASALSACLLAGAYFYLLAWPLPNLERSLVYVGRDQLHVVQPNSLDSAYSLTNPNGSLADVPTFAVTSTGLCYWSADDAALCMLSTMYEKRRWYPMRESKVASDLRVERIVMAGDRVFLNMESADREQAVMALDFSNGSWERLDSVRAIRVDPKGSGRAVVLSDGGFALTHVSDLRNRTHLCAAEGFNDWDYDFAQNRLYLLRRNSLEIIQGSGASKTVDVPCQGFYVYFQPNLKEVWVTGNGAFTSPRLLVFSASGKFLGNVGVVYNIFGAPQAMDKELHSLIRKHLEPVDRERKPQR